MGFTPIAAAAGASGNTTTVTSDLFDSTAGDLALAGVSAYDGSPFTYTPGMILDSRGNPWNLIPPATWASHQNTALYWSRLTNVGPGHSVTWGPSGGGATYPAIAVRVFGGAKASPFDQATRNHGGAPASTIQPGSLTPSAEGALLVSVVGWASADGSASINGGFTAAGRAHVNGVNVGVSLATLIQPAAAAVNPTWTLPSAAAEPTALIAAFLAAPAPAGGWSPVHQQWFVGHRVHGW